MDANEFHRAVFVTLLGQRTNPTACAVWSSRDYTGRRAAVLKLYREADAVVAFYELAEAQDGHS